LNGAAIVLNPAPDSAGAKRVAGVSALCLLRSSGGKRYVLAFGNLLAAPDLTGLWTDAMDR